MVDVKFCGLTRRADAELAVALGAAAIGVVFAPSPRQVTAQLARDVLAATVGTDTVRVGVFVEPHADRILPVAGIAQLDVIQVHGRMVRQELVHLLREGLRVWVVQPIMDNTPLDLDLPTEGELVLLDTSTNGRTGGTGKAFDWKAARGDAERLRARFRLGVAGGLNAANVATAVHILDPDLVDVSSGVESEPGIKDHQLMKAFMCAAVNPLAT